MKKNFLWKNIIIGKIDKNHPQTKEINKALDEMNKVLDEINRPLDEFNKVADDAFTSVSKMPNDITSFTDDKLK